MAWVKVVCWLGLPGTADRLATAGREL